LFKIYLRYAIGENGLRWTGRNIALYLVAGERASSGAVSSPFSLPAPCPLVIPGAGSVVPRIQTSRLWGSTGLMFSVGRHLHCVWAGRKKAGAPRGKRVNQKQANAEGIRQGSRKDV